MRAIEDRATAALGDALASLPDVTVHEPELAARLVVDMLCETDDDCAGDIAQICLGLEAAPLCLPVCVEGVCPAGLDCFGQTMPPVCV